MARPAAFEPPAAGRPPDKDSAGSIKPIAKLARPAGFEPATSSLEGSCSIQLSYGRARAIN